LKLKNKIYLLQVLIALSSITFFILFYNAYINQKEKDLEANIKTISEVYKLYMGDSLNSLYDNYHNKQKLFYDIHHYAQNEYLKDTSQNLETLKDKIKNYYNFKDFNIDIFLIDKNYTITNSTFQKDIGFNLSIIEDAKLYLDKTSKDSKIYVASNVSIDILEYLTKVYSYSKIGEGNYFEMGFILNDAIYTKLKQNVEKIYEETHHKISLYRVIETSDNKQQYYNDLLNKPKEDISKKEFEKSLKKFDIDKPTDDKYINCIRENKIYKEIIDNRYIVYVPLLPIGMHKHFDYNNILLKLEIDITDYQQTLQKTKENFYAFGFLLFLLLMILYYFIRYNFYKPMVKITDLLESEKKIEDKELLNKNDEFGILVKKYNKLYDSLKNEIGLNRHLLAENKRFIADTVHQIRTPLTNIMMNGEMVKRFQTDDKLSLFIDQIDASINMLSNSYEDLAYITSYEMFEYKPNRVLLSDMMHQRIKFFSTIARVNFKEVISNIEDGIYIQINEIELERLIDNNISNGIKYGEENKNIHINLIKDGDTATLTFKTYGKSIQNKEKVFDRNYRENEAKRGLGLGLNMVKGICEKYGIGYFVLYENGQNIFTYTFKV